MKWKSLHVFSAIHPREPKPMNARICGEGGLALIPALCPLVENVYLWLLGLVHASQARDKTWSHRHALGWKKEPSFPLRLVFFQTHTHPTLTFFLPPCGFCAFPFTWKESWKLPPFIELPGAKKEESALVESKFFLLPYCREKSSVVSFFMKVAIQKVPILKLCKILMNIK